MQTNKIIDYKPKYKIKKLSEKELSILCNQISIMLESGCEITKIIEILKEQSNLNTSQILNYILNEIINGNSISQSFENTTVFPNFFISMVKSGELSGNLGQAMMTLAIYYDKEQKIKSKIKIISLYPKIVTLIAFIATIFIMVFIVPNFEMVFVNNDITPPKMTQVLINLSLFIRVNYMYIIISLAFMAPILIYYLNTSIKVKRLKERMNLILPIIGDLNKVIITARFCKSFKMLISSGVNILHSIQISSSVLGNEIVYKKLLISQKSIKNGNTIAYSLSVANIFPRMFIHMINVGEESGRIDECLDSVDKYYNNELNIKIERIMKLIEPVTISILSIFIGVIMLAMVMPMFDAMLIM